MKSFIFSKKSKQITNRHKRLLNFIKNLFTPALLVSSTLLFFTNCEEKIPVLPYNQPLGELDTLTVPPDLIEMKSVIVPSRLGEHAYLYVGENEWLSAFSLLKFQNLAVVPDTLDSLISCELYLFSNLCLIPDSQSTASQELKIGLLMSTNPNSWEEDSVTNANFNLYQYQLENITTFSFSATDTIIIDLTSSADKIFHTWRNANHGFLLSPQNSPTHGICTFYSRQTTKVPYLELIYIENGDTIVRKITCSADVSILQYNPVKINAIVQNNCIPLSAGLSGYIFIKVNLDQLNIDRNWVVADAILNLKIDSLNTAHYYSNTTVYIELLDSTSWQSSYLANLPTLSENVSTTLSYKSSSLTFSLPKKIQSLTSGDTKNFGFVIWAAPTSYNITTYSIFSPDSPVAQRPYLKILLFKER